MNILAIETSTDACSVALSVAGEVRVDHRIASQQHALLVLPMIDNLLANAQISRNQIDGIAFGQGPGSFTGVRVGVAVTQGIALGLDIGVIGVSTLATLAAGAVRLYDAQRIASCIDARMNEIYFGAYVKQGDLLLCVSDDCVIDPAELPQLDHEKPWMWIGSGVEKYHQALLKQYPIDNKSQYSEMLPDAQDLLSVAQPAITAGLLQPAESAEPVYLRNKVALTTQERALKSARSRN